jgi:hypothetical protein
VGKIFEWRMLSEQHDMQNLMEVRRALEYAAAARAVVCGTEDNSASSKSLSRNAIQYQPAKTLYQT